jgi:hypothetical protein
MHERDAQPTDRQDQPPPDTQRGGYLDADRARRRARWKRLATAAGVAVLTAGMHLLRRMGRRR